MCCSLITMKLPSLGALNTFLDGLGELGIDKGLIKNKKLLSKNLPRKIVIMRRVHRI